MFGVANAKNGLLAIAKALGTGVEKQLVKKAIPLVGGVVGGGLTYAKEKSEDIIDIECDIEFVTNEETEL